MITLQLTADQLHSLDLELNMTQVDDDRLEHSGEQEHPHRDL